MLVQATQEYMTVWVRTAIHVVLAGVDLDVPGDEGE